MQTFPIVFALARFRGFFAQQKFTVLVFEEDGIELRHEGEGEKYGYGEVEKVVFEHRPTRLPGWVSALGGALTQPKPDRFLFRIDGQWQEFELELDSLHRRDDVLEVLKGMYAKGVELEERRGAGQKSFLLEPVSDQVFEEKRTAFQAQNPKSRS